MTPYRQCECLFTTVTVVWYHCMGQPTNIECNTGNTIKSSEYWGRAANVTDPLEYKAGWSGFTLFAIQSDPASVKCSNYYMYYEKLKF